MITSSTHKIRFYLLQIFPWRFSSAEKGLLDEMTEGFPFLPRKRDVFLSDGLILSHFSGTVHRYHGTLLQGFKKMLAKRESI